MQLQICPGFVRKTTVTEGARLHTSIKQDFFVLCDWRTRQRVCLSVGKALSSQVRVRDASFRVCSFCISCAVLMIYPSCENEIGISMGSVLKSSLHAESAANKTNQIVGLNLR